MHKSVAFEKQLPTAVGSSFSTILSSSSSNLYRLCTPLVAQNLWFSICFSILLRIGRFLWAWYEEVMEDRWKTAIWKKTLATAVPRCFFKVHHANFSLFSSFFLPVSHFFIFSTPLRRLKRGQEGGPGALPDPTTLCTPKSAKSIEKSMVFCYFLKSVLARNGKRRKCITSAKQIYIRCIEDVKNQY